MKRSIIAMCAGALATVAVFAAAVVYSSSAPAQARRVDVRSAADRPATAPPATAGMVVAVDPETGALGMPSPEQRQALEQSDLQRMNLSQEGLVEVHHPDGSVSIDLQGRFQEYAIVHVGADGRKTFTCVDDPAAAMQPADATARVDRPAPAATASEEE